MVNQGDLESLGWFRVASSDPKWPQNTGVVGRVKVGQSSFWVGSFSNFIGLWYKKSLTINFQIIRIKIQDPVSLQNFVWKMRKFTISHTNHS
jgi:hypothetical protein